VAEQAKRTGLAVRPYHTKSVWKGGNPKKGKNDIEDGDENSKTSSTSVDVPKGPKKWYVGADGKVHVIVLVGKFSKVVEIATFVEAKATPQQLELLASAKEAPELQGS
jgi:hypothetical protein